MNIENFYTNASLNGSTGEFSLSNFDGSNSSIVRMFKQVDLHDDLKYSPRVFIGESDESKVAKDGSYKAIGDEVFYRIDSEWIKIFSNEYVGVQDKLEIGYFDPNIVYPQFHTVSFNRKLYFSKNGIQSEMGYTLDQSIPDTLTEPDTQIGNISGIFSDGEAVYIKSAKTIFEKREELVTVIESRNDSGNAKERLMFGSKLEIINGRVLIDRDFEYNVDNVLDMAVLDGNIVIITIDKVRVFEMYSTKSILVIETDAYSDGCLVSSFDTDMISFIDSSQSRIRTLSTLTGQYEEHTLSLLSNVKDMAIHGDGTMYYIDNRDNMMHKVELYKSEWKRLSVEDIFKRTLCPNIHTEDNWFTNIVNHGEPDYASKYGIQHSDSFCIMNNKYLFIAHGTRITRLDVSTGVFDEHTPVTVIIGGSLLSGCTMFRGMLYTSNSGTDIIEIDPETLTVTRTIDMSGLIAGEQIHDMCELSGTLFIYTSNRKMYTMTDIDGLIIGVVQLEAGTSESSICVIDSNIMFISNSHSTSSQVYALTVDKGERIDVTAIPDNNVAMTVSFGNLYVLDRTMPSRMINYKRENRITII